jgi:hypothetical protein
MGIFVQQGWIPELVKVSNSSILKAYFSDYIKFDPGQTRLIEAEAPLNGNRDFKYLGDHAEFILRINLWKHDASGYPDHGYSAQSWHDTFINNFYQVPLWYKTHSTNYNIKGKDGATMEFMATNIRYGILNTPQRETTLDITIQSLEYIDQTKISVPA